MADRRDTVEPAVRSRIMGRVKSKNTAPEIYVRREVHRAGHRFRLHRKDLPGRPDIVFPKYKTAVFVHGCYWHWHGCKRSRMPETNREYWQAKINGNKKRDADARVALESLGWHWIVIWECALQSGTNRLLLELEEMRQGK